MTRVEELPSKPEALKPATVASVSPVDQVPSTAAVGIANGNVRPAPRVATGGAAILDRLRLQKAAAAAKVKKAQQDAESIPTVTFLFASQTGTAEEVAKSLNDEAPGKGFKSRVSSMDTWTYENISAAKTPVLVIVASSTGDGDAPDNSAQSYLRLKQPAPADHLKGVMFTVLGLGDSNYSKFMEVSRNIKRRLLDQGATEFYACKEADEVDGIEDIIDAWKDGIWPALSIVFAAAVSSQSLCCSNEMPSMSLSNAEFLWRFANRTTHSFTFTDGVSWCMSLRIK